MFLSMSLCGAAAGAEAAGAELLLFRSLCGAAAGAVAGAEVALLSEEGAGVAAGAAVCEDEEVSVELEVVLLGTVLCDAAPAGAALLSLAWALPGVAC